MCGAIGILTMGSKISQTYLDLWLRRQHQRGRGAQPPKKFWHVRRAQHVPWHCTQTNAVPHGAGGCPASGFPSSCWMHITQCHAHVPMPAWRALHARTVTAPTCACRVHTGAHMRAVRTRARAGQGGWRSGLASLATSHAHKGKWLQCRYAR